MIKTLIAVAVAGAFALPLATAASAAGDNQPGAISDSGGRFDQLDKNHDGFVSRDEAKDAVELKTRFTELDQNNDGKLTRDEYDALHAGARAAVGATGTGRKPGKGSGDSSATGANTK